MESRKGTSEEWSKRKMELVRPSGGKGRRR